MKPCETCGGTGYVSKRDPVLYIILRKSCPDCRGSGDMDHARKLDEQYHREWWDSYEKEREVKTWRF